MVTRSWLHTARSRFTPRRRCVMGCSPRAAAATTFTLYSGQVCVRVCVYVCVRACARVRCVCVCVLEGGARTRATPFQNVSDESGTPGSNQNTELWNKLTFHSLAGKANSAETTSVHNHNKNSFSRGRRAPLTRSLLFCFPCHLAEWHRGLDLVLANSAAGGWEPPSGTAPQKAPSPRQRARRTVTFRRAPPRPAPASRRADGAPVSPSPTLR